MRMDHHCPWVGNCVGLKNHKFFVLFLLYSALGCLHVSLSVFFGRRRILGSDVLVNILTIIGGALGGGIGFMFFFQLYLVCNNWTTLEAGLLSSSGHYKRLGVCRAFKLTFGHNPLLWAFPVVGPAAVQGLQDVVQLFQREGEQEREKFSLQNSDPNLHVRE